MPKIDLKKELKSLYTAPPGEIIELNVPSMNFLMIDGKGDPNTSPDYVAAIQALYAVSYALKFNIKRWKAAVDYAVMPLEGLWWVEGMSLSDVREKGAYQWTAMIMQPKYVTQKLFGDSRREVEEKKELPALSKMRFEELHEGRAAQVMHIGPYAEEAPTIARLHEFIRGKGGAFSGKHHEIYLGDPRRSAPEKLKTIIRQPYRA